MQPYNYVQNTARGGTSNLSSALLKGLSDYEANKTANIQRQLYQQQLDQAKAVQERKTLARKKFSEYVENRESDPLKWAELLSLDSSMAAGVKEASNAMKLSKNKSTKNLLLRANAALENKNYKAAGDLFNLYGKAYQEDEVRDTYSDVANSIYALEENPTGLKGVQGIIDMFGAYNLGEEYFLGKQKKAEIAKETAMAKKYEKDAEFKEREVKAAEDKNVINRMNARIEQAKLDFEKGKIPESTLKQMNKISGEIDASIKNMAEIKQVLMDSGIDFDGGFAQTAKEAWKKFWGDRDKSSATITKFKGLVNRNLLGGLPPGTASDNDVKIFRRGFPPENATKQEYEDFFTAVSNLERSRIEYLDVRQQWNQLNNHEGQWKKGASSKGKINGVSPRPNETLKQFIKRTGMTQSDYLDKQKKAPEIGSQDANKKYFDVDGKKMAFDSQEAYQRYLKFRKEKGL